MSRRRKLRLGFGAASVAALALAIAAGGSITAVAAEPRANLSKHERALIAQRIAAGESNVRLLVASQSTGTGSVADAIRRLGGTVEHTDDRVGYLRVSVPIQAADDVARLDGIAAVDVDEVLQIPNPRAADDGAGTNAAAPGPGTPAANPYMPTRDIGAPQFVAANPRFDGRGIVIGIVDSGVDLLAPELQTAKSQSGQTVPKIKDWVNFNHPTLDGDPTWVNMATQVKADNGRFTVGGTTYTAPAGQDDSNFRFGTFRENTLAGGTSEYARCGTGQADLDRDGTCGESFFILWDGDEKVWVDTNQNNSFADQKTMERFSKNRDFGVFGTDNPATAVRESVPFTVQTDENLNRVNLGIVSSAHGTHVAGIAAGKNFFGGTFDGAAPEAQIVSAVACVPQGGCTTHGLTEGFVYLIADAKADVVNMSIGGLQALNNGTTVFAAVYDKLMRDHNVQLFFSAGNSGPGINTIGFPSDSPGVMSVGAYVTKDTWMSNYGADAHNEEGLFVFSSRGPLENGAFKPTVIAPGAAVSTIPGWQNGSPVAEAGYPLPPGYGMFNGTSMAAPQATGGAALLLSAARQSGVEAKPWQLRQAIMSSARYISRLGAHEQGSGLFQVGAAWDLLRRKDFKEVNIVSSAPVNTILGDLLTPPRQGAGIYEREGWAPGQTGMRTITITRTGGGQSDTYNLSWTGNDGTFGSLPSTVNLKNGPATINVAVSPATAGVHSAILNVDDPTTGGIEYRVMNTIVAAEQFNAEGNWAVSRSGSADRPDKTTFFFNVPTRTTAFKTDIDVTAGRVRALRFHPWGVPFDSTATTPYCTAGTSCDPISRTAVNPTAGVWELTVDTSRTSTVSPGTFDVNAAILGVTIDPAVWEQSPTTVGTPYSREFRFTNERAAFTGRAVGTAFGSARSERPSISDLEMQVFEVPVRAGSTSLNARIGNPSDVHADLDLFVFRPNGTEAGRSADGDSEEEVTVNFAASATDETWFVLVDGFHVPSGSTSYDYLDSFANPAFGSITVADSDAPRASGASWTAMATGTATAAPAAGRFLRGFVQVQSGSTVLGRAEVRFRNVG
jgi:Subtilase family